MILEHINPSPKLVASAANAVATLLTSPKHIVIVKQRAAKIFKETNYTVSKQRNLKQIIVPKRKHSSSPNSDEEENTESQ